MKSINKLVFKKIFEWLITKNIIKIKYLSMHVLIFIKRLNKVNTYIKTKWCVQKLINNIVPIIKFLIHISM